MDKTIDILPFLGKGVSVVHVDENALIALHKPIDILSHPNSSDANKNALITTKYDYETRSYSLPNGQYVYLLNRLDSPTSGLILCTTRKDTAISVINAFENNDVKKSYIALCKGFSQKTSGTWKDTITKIKQNNQLRIEKGTDLSSQTRYKVLSTKTIASVKVSLILLEPITGRTHQLRWQCSQHHLPIIGDKTYGNFPFNKIFSKTTKINRLMLHSKFIEVNYKLNGRDFVFSATASLENFEI